MEDPGTDLYLQKYEITSPPIISIIQYCVLLFTNELSSEINLLPLINYREMASSIENQDSTSIAAQFLELQNNLSGQLRKITFNEPVVEVLHPLHYASGMHSEFINKYLKASKPILFLGINPGFHSSCQTGIPFGDVDTVKNWFQITTDVDRDNEKVTDGINEAPCRVPERVEGLKYSYAGDESGQRFWSIIKKVCEKPENFFERAFIYNYCPIAIFNKNKRNLSLESLSYHDENKDYYELIEKLCDYVLGEVIKLIDAKFIVAFGRYSETRAIEVVKQINREDIPVEYILHPSPFNDNWARSWVDHAKQRLIELKLISNYTNKIQLPLRLNNNNCENEVNSTLQRVVGEEGLMAPTPSNRAPSSRYYEDDGSHGISIFYTKEEIMEEGN